MCFYVFYALENPPRSLPRKCWTQMKGNAPINVNPLGGGGGVRARGGDLTNF